MEEKEIYEAKPDYSAHIMNNELFQKALEQYADLRDDWNRQPIETPDDDPVHRARQEACHAAYDTLCEIIDLHVKQRILKTLRALKAE